MLPFLSVSAAAEGGHSGSEVPLQVCGQWPPVYSVVISLLRHLLYKNCTSIMLPTTNRYLESALLTSPCRLRFPDSSRCL